METWRVPEQVKLSWRCWGDSCVCYHHGTGDTHLFKQPYISILEQLQNQAMSVEDICAFLQQQGMESIDEEVRELIEIFLKELLRLSIIEKVEG
ncbi:MAG: HPr-rel-A system PqqD family peptide chaperone [Gammaproteobacteria bacterium]|nr:HPr-rel-A system PqqD family peptide chaperone [Gammaproteobacteria bacterium]